jgi:hypothetical protein
MRCGRFSGKIAGRPALSLAVGRNPWDGFRDCTTHGQDNGGRENVSTKERKPPRGDKRQFLRSIDPNVIRAIKVAAASLDKTASQVLEEAANEWLERHHAGKK